MITLRRISKSYGNQALFEEVSLQINQGERFALVGPNGTGKSTLFKLIMGAEDPDEGEISLRTGITFGYLPQETAIFSGRTVLDETVMSAGLQSAATAAKAKQILVGLGFRQTDFERPISELSGGWQMRVAIARLLLEEPDLLLLDEPTNHLDLESLLWFQNYLQNYRGAIFLISHDREFINDIVNRIVEVRQRKLNVYTGSFEDYLAQRRREDENLVSAYHRQQKEIKELEDFINKFRAKASTASRAQAKIKYLEKMERIELPETLATVGFSFPQPSRSGQNVLELKNVRQSYDGKQWVYEGLDLTLERGQKIALVGPNGSGKSTLIKLLAGAIPFQTGERKLGHNTEAGYFSQHRAEMFTAGRTVFEEALSTPRHHSEQTVRTLLGSFLFRGDAVFKKVDVLSGGEKSRLGLARLLLDPPNLLLLDEPTTHLDMASVDVLLEALKKFEGTICFISHDVYFIRQLADHIIHVNRGRVTWYPGDYDYFLHKKSQEEGEEGELFRSEERIEKAHHAPAVTPAKGRGGVPSPPAISGGHGGPPLRSRDDDKTAPSRKSKEQKRLEAEHRQAKYRQEQEAKRKQDVLKQLKEAESLLLDEMSRLETHQNPARVKELSQRLGDIQKRIKAFG